MNKARLFVMDYMDSCVSVSLIVLVCDLIYCEFLACTSTDLMTREQHIFI